MLAIIMRQIQNNCIEQLTKHNKALYDVSTYDMIMLIFNQETVTQRHELNLKTGHGRHTMSQTDEL